MPYFWRTGSHDDASHPIKGMSQLPLPLFGRSSELVTVSRLMSEAGGGAGRVLVLDGEAGSGKTRLLSEAVPMASSRGFEVLVGSADELQRDRPFGVFVDALGLLPNSEDEDRAEIGRMVAGDDVAGTEHSAGQRPDLGFRMVELLVTLVERLAGTGPLMLVLEDLHWADPLSLRTVRAIGRSASQLPVLLAVTLRPYPRHGELERTIWDLAADGGCHLRVGPLEDEAVRSLASAVAGGPLGRRLERHVAGAGGNPLFVIELLRALRDEGVLAVEDGRVEASDPSLPGTLRQTLLRRIGFLPGPAHDILKVGAVLGTRFPVSELGAVMDRSPVELLSGLEQAIDAGLLEESGGELSFRHELIREALYETLPLAIRKGLHRQAAAALAAVGLPSTRVADHFFLGACAGDAEAVEWLASAARQVATRAPAAAVRLLERAVELADPADPQSDLLVCDLAPLLIQTGRAEEAAGLSQRVLDRAPAPAVESALRRALGEVLWTKGWLEDARIQLEAAAQVPGVAEGERLGALALAANVRLFLGEPEEAGRRAGSAAVAARQQADDFALCLSLQTLAIVADARGDVAEAVELGREAVAIAERSDQPRVGHLHPHLYLGLILIDADRLTDAEAALTDGRRRAEERGTVLWLPLYHGILAMRRVFVGEWDDGLAELQAGLAVADDVGTRLHAPILHGLVGWIALQRGDLRRAQERLDVAAEELLAGTTSTWRAEAERGVRSAEPRWPLEWGLWIQGLIYDARGDQRGARALLEDAWAVAAPLRFFLSHRLFAPDLVRVAIAEGSRQTAAAVTAEVEEGARRSGTAAAAGAALRCRGLLHDDPAILLQAVGQFRRSPSVMELAAALEDAGAALARAGRTAEAVDLLREALGLFERAGADQAAGRTRAALRSLGVRRRAPGPRRRPALGWDSLTATELTVAGLVAEGLTSRQVAERLFVSRRTVETHLAHLFAKLGISSRAQLAAEVVRRKDQ